MVVADLVENQHYLAGTKVSSIGAGQVTVDRTSTNGATASSQTVKFMTPTTLYTSSGQKTILIGGTFANNTNNQVGLTVEVTDTSVGVTVKHQVRFQFLVLLLSSPTLVRHFLKVVI